MRKQKTANHIQLHFLAKDLQELHELEVKAAEKFPLTHRGATVPETLLFTKTQPKPLPQTVEQVQTIAMGKLVPGRFSHIVIAKKGNMRQVAVALRLRLKKEHNIEIGILAL